MDANFDPIDQDGTVGFLKMDLLDYYKKNYKQEKCDTIKHTFVVITPEFFRNLPEDRRYLCEKIIYTNDKGRQKEFYSAGLSMMKDISKEH